MAKVANSFGTDALIQSPDLKAAAAVYVENLGLQISGESPLQQVMFTGRKNGFGSNFVAKPGKRGKRKPKPENEE